MSDEGFYDIVGTDKPKAKVWICRRICEPKAAAGFGEECEMIVTNNAKALDGIAIDHACSVCGAWPIRCDCERNALFCSARTPCRHMQDDK